MIETKFHCEMIAWGISKYPAFVEIPLVWSHSCFCYFQQDWWPFVPGDRVFHARFGPATVVSHKIYYGSDHSPSTESERVMVKFDRAVEKHGWDGSMNVPCMPEYLRRLEK